MTISKIDNVSKWHLVATLNFDIPVGGNAKMKRKLNSARMKVMRKQ